MTVRTEHDGPVLVVTIDRPEALNAVNTATEAEMRRIWDEIEKRSDDGSGLRRFLRHRRDAVHLSAVAFESAREGEGRSGMSEYGPSLTPRMRPINPKRSTIVSVLDVGTSKVVCLIAELLPVSGAEALKGRSHKARIIGLGHQRARGIKGGAIIDLEAAEWGGAAAGDGDLDGRIARKAVCGIGGQCAALCLHSGA